MCLSASSLAKYSLSIMLSIFTLIVWILGWKLCNWETTSWINSLWSIYLRFFMILTIAASIACPRSFITLSFWYTTSTTGTGTTTFLWAEVKAWLIPKISSSLMLLDSWFVIFYKIFEFLNIRENKFFLHTSSSNFIASLISLNESSACSLNKSKMHIYKVETTKS